jgi:signal transduction histidine kinase
VLAWHVTPIWDEHGRLTHWASTQRDVTERRQLERETLDISAREQRRIASDLHDALQQHLIGTALQAKVLAKALSKRGDAHAAQAAELYALVQEGVSGLRTVVQGIMPVQPNDSGLMVALETLTTRIAGLYGAPCTFVYESPIRVPNVELATQLYHIAQEALSNAAKHAAVAIRVSLTRLNGHVALTVADDGQGFVQGSDAAGRSGGIGLRLMAYRARLVGAQLEISTRLGEGTVVTCTFDPKSTHPL